MLFILLEDKMGLEKKLSEMVQEKGPSPWKTQQEKTDKRMAKIKTLRTVHVGEDVEQEEHFSTVGGNADWYNHYGKQFWKQPRCPSTEEWIRKTWFIYTMEYYAAEKNNDIMKFAGKWMELENVILSELAMVITIPKILKRRVLK
ncbi:hypothetical protein STEG23_037655 [Scotinomys teguina]